MFAQHAEDATALTVIGKLYFEGLIYDTSRAPPRGELPTRSPRGAEPTTRGHLPFRQ